jgi:hypothetical protein
LPHFLPFPSIPPYKLPVTRSEIPIHTFRRPKTLTPPVSVNLGEELRGEKWNQQSHHSIYYPDTDISALTKIPLVFVGIYMPQSLIVLIHTRHYKGARSRQIKNTFIPRSLSTINKYTFYIRIASTSSKLHKRKCPSDTVNYFRRNKNMQDYVEVCSGSEMHMISLILNLTQGERFIELY